MTSVWTVSCLWRSVRDTLELYNSSPRDPPVTLLPGCINPLNNNIPPKGSPVCLFFTHSLLQIIENLHSAGHTEKSHFLPLLKHSSPPCPNDREPSGTLSSPFHHWMPLKEHATWVFWCLRQALQKELLPLSSWQPFLFFECFLLVLFSLLFSRIKTHGYFKPTLADMILWLFFYPGGSSLDVHIGQFLPWTAHSTFR